MFRHRVPRTSLLLVGLTLLATSPLLTAGTVYTNFGPGLSYCGACSRFIGGGAVVSGPGQSVANRFTPGSTTLLDSIDLALTAFLGSNIVDISLTADSGGLPGAALESFVVPVPVFFPITSSIVDIPSQLHPLLAAGSLYWLTVSAPDPVNDWLGWNFTAPVVNGNVALASGNGPWISDPGDGLTAFQVNGAVPESSTLLLPVFGLALCYLLRRLHRPPARCHK